jgi:hypothetical protein
MSNDQIPENIRRFIFACIDSVEQLEVLAMLHDQPDKDWTYLALSQELRSTESSVEKRVRDLVDRRVIHPIASGSFRFNPRSEEVRQVVHDLVGVYRLRPYRVMELIFSKPVNAMQSFADAFKFKKEDS